MQKIKLYIVFSILVFSTINLSAQEVRDDASLNYTYIGPVLSTFYDKVEYRDWIDNSTRTEKMSGYSLSGGIAIDIFAKDLCGDFHLKYNYSQLDYTITNLEFSMSGKYLYSLNEYISIGAGLGCYFESPPSNREHNGSAGVQLPLTAIINTTPDTKLFIDLLARYGSFGIGENSKVLSAGMNIGFVYKVGKI